MDLQIRQQATLQRSGWWEWAVWLSGSDDDLDRIDYVEYVLHPTFPDPVKRVKDRRTNFRLDASGWGEFKIFINVHLKDGRVEKLEHWLELSAPGMPDALAKDVGMVGMAPVPKRLFLSSSIADAPFTEALEDAFEVEGITVLTSEDYGLDSARSSSVDSMRDRPAAALFVVSDARNAWLARDVREMQSRKVPLLAAVIGYDTPIPHELNDALKRQAASSANYEGGEILRFQVKDRSDPEVAARSIAERVKQFISR